MADAPSDVELLTRCGTEPELFGLLFDRHFETIYRYLERRIGEEGAEEIAAEVFRIGFEQRRRVRPLDGSALPWLYGVATKLMLRRWRTERRRLRALARLEVTAERDGAIDGAEDRLDARAARAALLDGLAALPPRDRDVVVLVAWEDLSYEEVATALAIPVGTVRSRLNRARRQLREPLGVIGHEPVTIICEPQGEAR